MREYVVCEEIINDVPSGCYSVRINADCAISRFIVVQDFDTFEEADEYLLELISEKQGRPRQQQKIKRLLPYGLLPCFIYYA